MSGEKRGRERERERDRERERGRRLEMDRDTTIERVGSSLVACKKSEQFRQVIEVSNKVSLLCKTSTHANITFTNTHYIHRYNI